MATFDSGSTGFIIVCMALVNLMTPGLAFFYGGLVRQQNVLTIIMQNFVSMGLVTMIWIVWGFSLCFGESGKLIGNPSTYAMLSNIEDHAMHGSRDDNGALQSGGIPGLAFAGFQGMFAVIAPALMTGAFADRMMFGPYLVFITAWVHLVYFPFCHSVWGGGFLAVWGVWDFAGGIVVHISAGFSALAAVMAMPHRRKMEVELDTDPHNIPFVALGTGMLWFGWFGFNAGSALAADGVAAYAAINTEISASCALFAWMVIEWVHKGKPTLVGACVGAIAGLATITPAAGFVQPWAAMVIGLISAPWCYGLVELVKDKLVIDDALDVFAVHGMGGFLGTLCIGIFADKSVSGSGPEASGEQFGKQFAAAVGTAAYAYVVGFALVKIIGKFMQILPPQHALELGLDASIHGERAYKDTSNNGPALSKV